ncbi:type IV toxin-antitoxin system AbiEi family antitoxin domain-containing protein [Aquimarina agarilytica]|uniref:type IV toxin-antitoxin system AbiEi family antitoxin domain-containing protein n=1 Tax=Aquimarina agarilytica TaxID=1087449 RepID=UPI000288EE7A|nr:DUF6088 family protein [Aquimarina agarilytica]
MNTTAYISQKISQFPSGKVFDYDDLSIDRNQMSAAAKALSRMVSEGKIERFKKGKYYIPEKTVFGKLKPSDTEVLNTYLFNKKKQVAYITGTRLYNSLGLTTQVPVTFTIASWDKQFNKDFGKLRVKSTKSYLPITSTNVSYLQVLDVIKDFKRIPDTENSVILQFLKKTLSKYSSNDLKRIVTYAKAYPPKVNALLGAILEALQITTFSKQLQRKINTLSRYSFGILETELPTIKNWNIN